MPKSTKVCTNHIIVDDFRKIPMTDDFFKWTNRVLITVNGNEIGRYQVSARLFIFNCIKNKLEFSKLVQDLKQRNASGNQMHILPSGTVMFNNNPIIVFDTQFGIAHHVNTMNTMISNILQ